MESDNSIRRRTFLSATGGAAATLAVAGCFGGDGDDGDDGGDGGDGGDGMDGGDGNESDGGDGNESDGGDGGDGGTLNMINSTITSLDPIQSTDTASGRVIRHVYETLTTFPDGIPEVENLLLDSYEVSDDLLTYTVNIKEDVQFHNGDTLTAQDFVYSWRRLAESEYSERVNFVTGASAFLAIESETDDEGAVVPESLAVEATDDTTLEFTLSTPAPAPLQILTYDAFAAVPEGYVGDIEGYDGEVDQSTFSSEDMVGTGSFEFDTWSSDAEAEITRYDDYHGSVANLDAVHWQIIEDTEAQYTYAIEQNADIFALPTSYYDPSLIDAETDDRGRDVGTYGPLENGETVDYAAVPQLSTYYLAFNVPNVPHAVRQAIAYVSNKQELVEEIFAGRGVPAHTFTPPGMWPGGQEAYDSFVENYQYSRNETDRGGAEQVLSDAGYTSDDPFELTLTTYDDEAFQEAGRLTRDKLSGLGISLELETTPFASLQERGRNGELAFYSLGWTWSWPSPAYGMYPFEPANTDTSIMPEEANGFYLDWQDADTDASQQAQEAWETVENNPDPDAEDTRNEAYTTMEQAVQDDMVLMPLYHDLQERFHYQYVDVATTGTMGSYMQVHNETSLNE